MPQIVGTQKIGEVERLSGIQSSDAGLHKPLTLDITIVLGEGPVKPVLLPSELSGVQQHSWSSYIKNPLNSAEPDFYVIEGEHELAHLSEISSNSSLDEEEKAQLLVKKRNEWQHRGRF